MPARPIAAAAMAAWMAAGLAAPVAAETGPMRGAHGLTLPASFTGTLPCADCEGIRHHLDLDGESQSFALRREWLDGDATLTEDMLGRWHADPARRAIVLAGPTWDAPIEWEVLGNGHLRLLDREGRPIESDLPYELEPGPLAPTDVTLPMTGQFTYFADAALFAECLTGQRFPVAMEGGYLMTERAYLAARDRGLEPGAELMMTLRGTLTERPAMEGPPRRTLVVEDLLTVTPGGSCERSRAPADLVNTFWRLVSLGDLRPDRALTGREPYLLLFPGEDGLRFSATAGCNMMAGGATLEDGALEFGPAASTMMACPDPLDGWERALGAALGAAVTAETDGFSLTLRDSDGAGLAGFEAAYTPF